MLIIFTTFFATIFGALVSAYFLDKITQDSERRRNKNEKESWKIQKKSDLQLQQINRERNILVESIE